MIVEIIVIALVGALASILAHQSIAIFNDGLRPIVGQFTDNKIDKKALAATSFALSFGLVIGYGIPVSIGASILLIHSVLLGTDMIGTMLPTGKKGMVLAGLFGALYGVGLVVGLEALVAGFELLPYNFVDALGKIGNPVVIGFAVFPALAVAFQHGFKKGSITFVFSFVALVLTKTFGVISINDTTTIKLSPEGMTLLVGMAFLVYFSARIRGDGNSNQQLISVFAERVKRIKKYKFLLAIMGGLIASAASLLLIAGDPVSQELIAEGSYDAATLAILARGVGFVPLVFSTAIVSGVYGPAGSTLVFAAGMIFVGNPVLAFILGFFIMLIEILLLDSAAKGMDKFPGMRDMGEHIRTSMNKVLEVALLLGGALACETMAPGYGYFWIIGFYTLNKTAKKPLVDLAVGPVAAITLGIVLNILLILNLWTPPVLG
jgi:hypothetical protein